MALIVQKYGGTSVGTVEKIRNVARRVALTDMGYKAKSLTGFQIPVLTDSAFVKARIRKIDGDTIRDALKNGEIAVVAGFQWIDETGAITTLGRGGSDTSAVAVAAALSADVCEIYTDVDGVYTTDPNICEDAKKLDKISFEEVLEPATLGAKVLQIRSVEFGMRYGVRIHVGSSFNDNPGTIVTKEEEIMETAVVSGVAHTKNEAKSTNAEVPDRPGTAAKSFKPLSDPNTALDV